MCCMLQKEIAMQLVNIPLEYFLRCYEIFQKLIRRCGHSPGSAKQTEEPKSWIRQLPSLVTVTWGKRLPKDYLDLDVRFWRMISINQDFRTPSVRKLIWNRFTGRLTF